MFSSVQVVILFDVNSFAETCKSESKLEQNVTRLKLSCLKLLTEFGAQTEKGTEAVRWACKYYDSHTFKPDTSRKNFVDFNRKSFEDFENEITDRYCKAFDRKQSGDVDGANCCNTSDSCKPHYYILKKSLQEVLLDYNWDRPDISSPVKAAKCRIKAGYNKLLKDVGPYNTVIVCTNVPQNLQELKNFCGSESIQPKKVQITAEYFLDSILDPSMVKGLQEGKKICLNFVNVNDVFLSEISSDQQVTNAIHSGLVKLNGGLHSISNIVQITTSQVAEYGETSGESGVFPSPTAPVRGQEVQVSWWKKARCGRSRKPQPGPSFVWEDADGISYLKVQLEVLAVHGSASREWGSAVVVGVVRSSAVSILAVAGEMGHLYVCHAPNTVFTTLVHVLAKYQLSMVLKLSGGGIAVLSPWAGGIACLAVTSASGLATPLSSKGIRQESQEADPHLLRFVSQTVKKCLKSAPPHTSGEPCMNTKRFAANQTQRWFRPLGVRSDIIDQIRKRKVIRPERKAMQERLQKRYRPQILQPLANGDIGPVDYTDITQPPVDPPPVSGSKPNMSRAQQLVKKSHIVTAQQKVKEQRAEEEERVQATERRAAQASERARKSQALESQVLNAVSDIQDSEELVQSLVCLRDGDGMETDLFTTAQTIINLALMHVKNTGGTNMEEGLRKILGSGVLQTAFQISNRTCEETCLQQYKLQVLLHLELLWVLGYSSSSQTNDDEEEESRSGSIREYHLEEIMKMLRTISLRHNPTTMATFLQDAVLENYVETHGGVLVEIYEELNQPLPEPLLALTSGVGEVADIKPSSVNSHDSSVKSYSSLLGSVENPGSGKSREGRRVLPRHPSLKEASKRSIIVQKVTRTLSRTISEQSKPPPALTATSTSSKQITDNLRNVRRNLFVFADGAVSKPKLQQTQTVGSIPVSELRRSPRKKCRKSHANTPQKSIAISASPKTAHKTPIKGSVTPERGYKTPKSKKNGVLVPETPKEKVGQTIFNRHRVCKSTGTTLIVESPDVKSVHNNLGANKTTPRRLRASLTLTRRNSFYSGARSRNWERAKTRLLADRIRGCSDRRSLDSVALQNMGDASFLFSEIRPANHSCSQQSFSANFRDENTISTTKRKVLDFGLDNSSSTAVKESLGLTDTSHDECDNSNRLPLFTDSPAKSTRAKLAARGSMSLPIGTDLKTPVKNREGLLLCTPTKTEEPMGQSSRNIFSSSSSEQDFKVFSTPGKKTGLGNTNTNSILPCQSPGTPKQTNHNAPYSDFSGVTPSKKVQFSMTFTPSKHASTAINPQTPKINGECFSSSPHTPKSILKTPSKTHGKTPTKSPFHSPDISISSAKKTVHTPLKTPCEDDNGSSTHSKIVPLLSSIEVVPETPMGLHNSLTPVKVDGIVSYSEGEIELVSPKRKHTSSKSSTILFTSPFKAHPLKGFSENSPEKKTSDGIAASRNTVNREGVELSAMPNITSEDVEMMNSLIFGDFDPKLDTETLQLSDDEVLKLNLSGILSSLSSPDRRMSLSPLEVGCKSSEDSFSSLPEKQVPLLDITSILADNSTPKKKDQRPEFEKDCSLSPEISIDPKIKLYIERTKIKRDKESHVECFVDGKDELVLIDQGDGKIVSPICKQSVSNSSPIISEGLSEIRYQVLTEDEEGKMLKEAEKRLLVEKVRINAPVGEVEESLFIKDIEKNTSVVKENILHQSLTRENLSVKDEISPEVVKENSKGTKTKLTTAEKIPSLGSQDVLLPVESEMKVSVEETQRNVTITKDKEKAHIKRNNKISPNKAEECFFSVEEEKEVKNLSRKRLSAIEAKALEVVSEGSPEKIITTKSIKRQSHEDAYKYVNESSKKGRYNSNRRVSERVKNEQKKKESFKIERSFRTCRKFTQSFCELSSESEFSEDDIFCSNDWPTARSLKRKKMFQNYDSTSYESDAHKLLETVPLKNVENVIPSPSIESGAFAAEGDGNENISRWEIMNKSEIDIVSPTGKNNVSEECIQPYLPTRQSTPAKTVTDTLSPNKPETPSDWKIFIPKHKRKRFEMESGDEDDVKGKGNNDTGVVNGVKVKTGNVKKKKKKGVKLKLTKSGEHYQVSETITSVEGSDLSSSSDTKLCHSQSESILSSDQSDFQNPSQKSNKLDIPITKKRLKAESMITPLRFTRHMSKDLSVSPEFFQKLITLSPMKATNPSQRTTDEALGKRIEFEMMQENKVLQNSLTAYSDSDAGSDLEGPTPNHRGKETHDSIMEDEWSIKNVSGSSTMKTFIRKQKEKYDINMSPRVELLSLSKNRVITRENNVAEVAKIQETSASNILYTQSSPVLRNHGNNMQLSNPSFLSLVHLSVSPILGTNELEDRLIHESTSQSQMKPKSSRKLYRGKKGSL